MYHLFWHESCWNKGQLVCLKIPPEISRLSKVTTAWTLTDRIDKSIKQAHTKKYNFFTTGTLYLKAVNVTHTIYIFF